MSATVGREYCLKHPGEIIGLFGLDVFLGMCFSGRKTLLERVVDKYQAGRFPMPGYMGTAYKLSALIELRMARIYAALAERFAAQPAVHALFSELRDEEQEHYRLMLLCLYTVRLRPSIQFVPRISDAAIRGVLQRLRGIQRRIDTLSLAEALALTEELETGEINTIFDKLLGQVDCAESRLFDLQMHHLEGHKDSVPRRIQALRATLAMH